MTYDLKNVFYLDTELTMPTATAAGESNTVQLRQEESLPFRAGEVLFEGAERLATGVEARARSEGLPIAGRPAVSKRKKKPSKFSKAISAGMKTVKASTSYGAKGKINNAKRAFTAVTKTASKINKGGKVAKSGITRKIGLAVRKILK